MEMIELYKSKYSDSSKVIVNTHSVIEKLVYVYMHTTNPIIMCNKVNARNLLSQNGQSELL